MMEEQHDLAKWLAGEMTETERNAFEQTPEFETYNRISLYSSQLEHQPFDQAAMLQSVLSHQKSGNEVKVIPFYQSVLFKIAAVFVIGIGLLFLAKPLVNEKEYAANGKQTTFLLPDNSKVVLNSGSEINYKKWDWSNNRALDLKGEAFFNVSKGKKFDVNTDLGKVTVVGTRFNVKARNSRFEVECFEGKVKVQFGNSIIVLHKGEIVMAENGKAIPATPTNSSKPFWLRHEMRFNAVPLNEIITETERQYNISITQKGSISNATFTGILPADNLKKTLDIIEKTYQLKSETTQNKVVLSADE